MKNSIASLYNVYEYENNYNSGHSIDALKNLLKNIFQSGHFICIVVMDSKFLRNRKNYNCEKGKSKFISKNNIFDIERTILESCFNLGHLSIIFALEEELTDVGGCGWKLNSVVDFFSETEATPLSDNQKPLFEECMEYFSNKDDLACFYTFSHDAEFMYEIKKIAS